MNVAALRGGAAGPALHPPGAREASACAHCGAGLASGERFCCTGCEAAYSLVQGLGLDSFYRRREAPEGSLRPALDAPPLDMAPHAVPGGDGTHSLELLVAGLTCGACVWLVEQALAAEPDVLAARVSLSARRLRLAWRGEAARANDFAALLSRLGFRVAPWSAACLRVTEDAEGRELVRALGIAAFGAMNVMLLSVAVWAGWDMGEATRAVLHWTTAAVAMPVILLAGIPFYRSALEGVRAGRLNMDLAVSLGVLATAAMSLSEALRNGPYTWFDGATTLLALLLAGRVLDRAARRRTRQAVAELLALQEGTVTRLEDDGSARTVPAERLRAGDRMLVATGERLRLDAVLETGEALVDVSATTGESLPQPVAVGEALAAGAINLGPPFVARVTAAAADGSLAAMARLLERGEQARGRFVDIANRAVRFYVPAVYAVAALTFLGWWLWAGSDWRAALVPAVAVLIVTCPCGFAIAVPAVQVAAIGRLFRSGVLVSSGTALERLASADHVMLDKTGTLTEGRPSLLPGDWNPAQLRAAAGLARASQHPLARALVAACPEAPAVPAVREAPGRGLEAAGMRLGSAAFLGVPDPDAGLTLWFAEEGQPPVCFRFAERLRDDAPAAMRGLGALGLTVEVASGDAAPAVSAAAERSGIATWRAGMDPRAKAAHVEALRAAGRRPLVVGDGLNDAGALALAHVSACPEEGTDLAQTASDFVLRRASGLTGLVTAVVVARRAQRLARQNIAFSLTYNVLAVPMAVAGLVTPLVAALVMASSSLVVILNALRAGREGRRQA